MGNGFKTVFAIFFIIVFSSSTIAGISVSPLQQSISVKPGSETFVSVTVTNVKRGPQTPKRIVRLDLLAFDVSPYGRISFGEEFKCERSAVDWISFDDADFPLEPGESKEIKAKISVPTGADGDYWAAIMIGMDAGKKPKKMGVQIKLQTASGLFIHVSRRNYIGRGSIINTDVTPPEFALEESAPEVELEQVLTIRAELKNDGLVSLVPEGKALIYSGNRRVTASIPLYARRNRVLPNDSRYFTGVMSQPLPAGQYKMRTIFDLHSKSKRKITKDTEFTISEDMSKVWMNNFVADDSPALKIKPEQVGLKLTPGRLTAARFTVSNGSLSTIAARCRIENKGSQADWVSLKTSSFTLAPNAQRTVVCLVKVPSDAAQGKYNWTVHVETEDSGLIAQGENSSEQYEIPISVEVGAAGNVVASIYK